MRIIRINEGYSFWSRFDERIRAYKACNGLCFWCNRKTILYCPHAGYNVRPPSPLLHATLDHLYNNLNPKRKKYKMQPAVNACYECNQKRGVEDEKKFRIIIEDITPKYL